MSFIMDRFYLLFDAVLALLALGMFLGLVRAIAGPRLSDRIMGINIAGSLCTVSLAVLSVFLSEDWLLDVCLIYCMISFLAVAVITSVSGGRKGDGK